MDLEELKSAEDLSVRAYNICRTSNLFNIDLIINWYKKYGDFKKIRNCGVDTNNELTKICIKYNGQEMAQRTSGGELKLRLDNSISVRAYNVCLHNGLPSVESLIDYYKKYGSFSGFRNCGLKTNLELVAFCKGTIDSRLKERQLDDVEPALFLIENFSRLQQRIIRYNGYMLRERLSSGTYRALKDFLGCRGFVSIEDMFEKVLNNPAFDLGDFNFLGVSAIEKLAYFINSYKDTAQTVSKIIVREELINLNYRLTLDSVFPHSSLTDKIKSYSIFCAVQVAIDNEVLFDRNILSIFKNKFKIYNDSSIDFSNLNINLSKERIRQISKSIQDDLFKKMRFINRLIDESLDNYHFFPDSNVIFIDQRLNEKINLVNQTDFSKEWIAYLTYIYFSSRFELIGAIEDVLFRKNYNTSGRHNWNCFYLVNNSISEKFDFVLFINDFKLVLDSFRHNDVYFNLNDYVSSKYDIVDTGCISEIYEISKFIVKHEYAVEFDKNDNILLKKNTTKPLHECVYTSLNTIGRPASVTEIANKVLELFPEEVSTEQKVRAVLKRKFGFVPVGRSSVFGLIVWENEFSHFKGGTIRNLVLDYLKIEGSPRHIDSITNFVRKYRPNTYHRSIWDNLRTDTSGAFVFSNDRFVGLKSNIPDESNQLLNEYVPEKVKTWEQSFSVFVDFVSKNSRLPRSSGCPIEEIQLYRWYNIQLRSLERGELDLVKSNQLRNISVEFPIRGPRKGLSIAKNIENYESIIFDILNECPEQIASKEFLHSELVEISKLDGQLVNKILNKAPFLKRRLCIIGRPFYYYHTNSDILDISRDYDNIQDFIVANLDKADNRLEFYYKLMQKMIASPNPGIITGGMSRLIILNEVSQFYHKFIHNDSEILVSNRTRVILDNLIMGICESMANHRDISFLMDKEVYNNEFVKDFVSYLMLCGVVRLNVYELKVEIVYLINYDGDKVILENNIEALFLPFVLKDYFIANMLQCEFMVLGFSVKYINRFNLISYE